jgi:hypothetical protein
VIPNEVQIIEFKSCFFCIFVISLNPNLKQSFITVWNKESIWIWSTVSEIIPKLPSLYLSFKLL